MPNGNEIALQIGAVAAAGAKGLTMFQSIQEEIDKDASDWNGVVKDTLLSIAVELVRDTLRLGDVQSAIIHNSDGGDPLTDAPSLVEVVRSDTHILIVAVNTKASGYNSLLCHVDLDKHWKLHDHVVEQITLAFGPDVDTGSLDPSQLVEVTKGEIQSATGVNATIHQGRLVLQQLKLSGAQPVRFLVLPYARATTAY